MTEQVNSVQQGEGVVPQASISTEYSRSLSLGGKSATSGVISRGRAPSPLKFILQAVRSFSPLHRSKIPPRDVSGVTSEMEPSSLPSEQVKLPHSSSSGPTQTSDSSISESDKQGIKADSGVMASSPPDANVSSTTTDHVAAGEGESDNDLQRSTHDHTQSQEEEVASSVKNRKLTPKSFNAASKLPWKSRMGVTSPRNECDENATDAASSNTDQKVKRNHILSKSKTSLVSPPKTPNADGKSFIRVPALRSNTGVFERANLTRKKSNQSLAEDSLPHIGSSASAPTPVGTSPATSEATIQGGDITVQETTHSEELGGKDIMVNEELEEHDLLAENRTEEQSLSKTSNDVREPQKSVWAKSRKAGTEFVVDKENQVKLPGSNKVLGSRTDLVGKENQVNMTPSTKHEGSRSSTGVVNESESSKRYGFWSKTRKLAGQNNAVVKIDNSNVLPQEPLCKIFLLLLEPHEKIFELIQLAYPASTTTVGCILRMIPQNTTEKALASQRYRGLIHAGSQGKAWTDKNLLVSEPTIKTEDAPIQQKTAGIMSGEILIALPFEYATKYVIRLGRQILNNALIEALMDRNEPGRQRSTFRKRSSSASRRSRNTAQFKQPSGPETGVASVPIEPSEVVDFVTGGAHGMGIFAKIEEQCLEESPGSHVPTLSPATASPGTGDGIWKNEENSKDDVKNDFVQHRTQESEQGFRQFSCSVTVQQTLRKHKRTDLAARPETSYSSVGSFGKSAQTDAEWEDSIDANRVAHVDDGEVGKYPKPAAAFRAELTPGENPAVAPDRQADNPINQNISDKSLLSAYLERRSSSMGQYGASSGGSVTSEKSDEATEYSRRSLPSLRNADESGLKKDSLAEHLPVYRKRTVGGRFESDNLSLDVSISSWSKSVDSSFTHSRLSVGSSSSKFKAAGLQEQNLSNYRQLQRRKQNTDTRRLRRFLAMCLAVVVLVYIFDSNNAIISQEQRIEGSMGFVGFVHFAVLFILLLKFQFFWRKQKNGSRGARYLEIFS